MIDVTLVTCRAHPGLPEDDQFLLASLEHRGMRHRVAIWDDPQVDWSESSVTLLRAAWDSQTAILTSASQVAITQALQQIPAVEIVVKPRFGADAHGVTRLPPEPETIAAHFKRFGANGGLLIQPFIPGVELERERSLVFIGGQFSHALYRNPFGSGPTRQTPDNVHAPTAQELSYCRELLGSLPRLAYARVDLIPFEARPALMELEIIDPSLFFAARPQAADALAAEVPAALESCG